MNWSIDHQVEGKADVFSRPMDFSIDQSLIGYSDVLLSIAYHPFQLINRKTQLQHEKSLTKLLRFLIPSSSFLLFFLFTLLLYLVDWFLLKSSRLKKIRIGRKLLKLRPYLRPRMITISFVMFVFFIKSFFSTNLNTSTVILDYRDLLYSNKQLLRTTKELCFLEKSIECKYFEKVRIATSNLLGVRFKYHT